MRHSWVSGLCLVVCSALLVPMRAALPAPTNSSAWDAAYDPAARTRFIPVELWTGAPWDGHREIAATVAHTHFGPGGKKAIDGPFEWTRPSNGEKLLVYRRTNGGKVQLFTISSRKDGIGRVYDSRYGRDCVDEVKFPLGLWHEAETRQFDVPCNGGATQRQIRVTIEHLDFIHGGVPHALQFHWQVLGDAGRATDMHYVYQPEAGLIEEYGNE